MLILALNPHNIIQSILCSKCGTMKTFSEYLISTIVYYFPFISPKMRLSYTVFRYNLSIVTIKCAHPHRR